MVTSIKVLVFLLTLNIALPGPPEALKFEARFFPLSRDGVKRLPLNWRGRYDPMSQSDIPSPRGREYGVVPGLWRYDIGGGHFISCYHCSYSYVGGGGPGIGSEGGPPPVGTIGDPPPNCQMTDSCGGNGEEEADECQGKVCKTDKDCCPGHGCFEQRIVFQGNVFPRKQCVKRDKDN